MEQSGSMILTEWSTTTTEHTLTDPCWLWADDWWWSEKWNGTKEGNEWVNEWSTLLSSIHFSFITPHSGCNRTLPGCHFPRLTAVIRWKGEWKKKTQTKYQRAKYKWKCVILPFVLLVGLFFIIHFHRSSLFFSPFAPFSLPSLRFSPLKRSERRKTKGERLDQDMKWMKRTHDNEVNEACVVLFSSFQLLGYLDSCCAVVCCVLFVFNSRFHLHFIAIKHKQHTPQHITHSRN